jgi:hypothetical protein
VKGAAHDRPAAAARHSGSHVHFWAARADYGRLTRDDIAPLHRDVGCDDVALGDTDFSVGCEGIIRSARAAAAA